MQALLPFFIEGASPIEPNNFWKYFLIYDRQECLASIMTLYEAYQNADKMRMKISQVLVMPPYQRQGIASTLYRMVFDMYRLNNDKCTEIIVEDAADDFQRI